MDGQKSIVCELQRLIDTSDLNLNINSFDKQQVELLSNDTIKLESNRLGFNRYDIIYKPGQYIY